MRTLLLSALATGIFGCAGIFGDDSKESDTAGGGGGGGGNAGDEDGDGFTPSQGDCDDNDPDRHPGAEEECDGIDNDCDGEIDEGGSDIFYVDADGDGYGDPTAAIAGCDPGAGYADNGDDCNDTDATIHPDATELCNGIDDDCDDEIDEGAATTTWHADADGDGYGSDLETVDACDPPEGYIAVGGDCDDGDPTSHPEGVEVCDGADNDCDGRIDNDAGDMSTWYQDADADGYGSADVTTESCRQPLGYVADDTDCDDTTSAVSPGAEEVCNEVDDDCDGDIDEDGAAGTWYADADGDGYGDPGTAVTGCEGPAGYIIDGTDCDDTDASVHPTATEVYYDGVDQNCDGLSDYDADGDGYDSEAYGGDDCDDTDAAINPGASETWYDGIDQDCSGGSDYDADGDGYDAEGYGGDDCDDGDATIHPDAWEDDTSLDNDCDGDVEAAPVAVADYDPSSSLTHCLPLTLDGSGSYDDDGDTLYYDWSLESAPATSSRTTSDITETDDEMPTFVPDVAGDYTFSLSLTDSGDAWSYPDDVTVTIAKRTTNNAPVADAGSDESYSDSVVCTPISYGASYSCAACRDHTFSLDGSASSDADGEDLTYSWSVYSGSGTLIGSTTGSTATVTVDGPTPTYGATTTESVDVRLTVTDCYGATSAASTVTLSLECKGS